MDPQKTHHKVGTNIDLVENDINVLIKQSIKKLKSNLTNKEEIAMEELDFIITNADKGGAVIIMATDNYIKETYQQLSDKANYN